MRACYRWPKPKKPLIFFHVTRTLFLIVHYKWTWSGGRTETLQPKNNLLFSLLFFCVQFLETILCSQFLSPPFFVWPAQCPHTQNMFPPTKRAKERKRLFLWIYQTTAAAAAAAATAACSSWTIYTYLVHGGSGRAWNCRWSPREVSKSVRPYAPL